MASRKRFIESIGASCANWQWSWSFINETQKFVVFGAWEHLGKENGMRLIFSERWERNANGKINNGFDQSLRHIERVQEEGFELYTFPMSAKEVSSGGKPRIKSIIPKRMLCRLVVLDGDYYAAEVKEPVAQAGPKDGLQKDHRHMEGDQLSVLQTRYERNPKARAECLKIFGFSCRCCGFDFEKRFGPIGRFFIHVHHIIPVSNRGKRYAVDPHKDLIPVCPNCHAMLHKRNPPYSLEEMKKIRLNK